jgi:AbrB family looped-hinge helix DNA binding protein
MSEKVAINDAGVITIPLRVREAYGLKADDELIVESSPQGILLRPVAGVPIELYSEERIAEFAQDDASIGEILNGK